MTRTTLIFIPLLVLAACATPRERCISSANRPVATLNNLILETQGNVQRGFALVEVQDVRVRRRTCEDTRRDGSTRRFRCDETEVFTRREPASINIAEERIKLAQLIERRDLATRQASAQTRQCIVVHPQ